MIKKECPNGKLDLRILDVSLLFNIRSFVKELAKTYDRIDILINNAAVINQSYQTTNEKLDITLSTNYLGKHTKSSRNFLKKLVFRTIFVDAPIVAFAKEITKRTHN